MLRFLTKLFVVPFYRRNAGFFLFFFFFFFGVVQAGSLIAYHRSLMLSILQSPWVLTGVMTFWVLYHLKCTGWCLRIINSPAGSFLHSLQTLPLLTQVWLYAAVEVMLFAPVWIYALMLGGYGWRIGYLSSALAVGIFQLFIVALGTVTLYRRLNDWLTPPRSFSFRLLPRRPKPFTLVVLYYFAHQHKRLTLSLKALSGFLIYIVLILNREGYDNDSFIFFFQLILLTHTVFAFKAVRFLEGQLAIWRNLPLSLFYCAGVYALTYAVLLLPEAGYLLYAGYGLVPLNVMLAYYCIAFASLCLLTAVQYTESMNANEYVKVIFALVFVSTFSLHAQAFWVWALILFVMSVLLFWNGFYRYEGVPDK
jgi:hypothetical protein